MVKRKLKKAIAVLTVSMIIPTLELSSIVDVTAEGRVSTLSSSEDEEDDEIPEEVLSGYMEDILKGLSKFTYKEYTWPDSLSVGSAAFGLAQKIYSMKNNDKSLFWDSNNKDEMQDFYSSTNWNNFEGMYETVEITNSCKALLTEEVLQYEDLLDEAAEKNGFTVYKEIFKAIAQTRFNDHKIEYATAKELGLINGNGNDMFDLFSIDGSWIDGGDTPVGEALAPTPTPEPTSTPTPTDSPFPTDAPTDGFIATPTPIPTLMPESDDLSDFEKEDESMYSVSESINIAAKAFSAILEDAVYPSPFNSDSLIGAVEGFEYGGTSTAIKNRYNSSPFKLSDYDKFVSFTLYYEKQADDSDDVDTDSIIAEYAKVISHGDLREKSDVYGKYKYSDQKFYEKVFENYRCTSGGSIDYGELPSDMKEILRQCMQTWDSKVTKERKAIIQQGVLLYGVTYSMDYRNSPSASNPKYLDCSSFVGQCYWRAGIAGSDAVNWTTSSNSSNFRKIDASQLIPGDIGQIHWPGNVGGSDHVGIYIGTVNGVKYWLHCTGGTTDGVYHAPGKGIKINNYSGFNYYGRYPSL